MLRLEAFRRQVFAFMYPVTHIIRLYHLSPRITEFVGSHKIEETRFASVATVPFHVRFTSALTADNVTRRVVVDGTALVAGAPLTTWSFISELM